MFRSAGPGVFSFCGSSFLQIVEMLKKNWCDINTHRHVPCDLLQQNRRFEGEEGRRGKACL